VTADAGFFSFALSGVNRCETVTFPSSQALYKWTMNEFSPLLPREFETKMAFFPCPSIPADTVFFPRSFFICQMTEALRKAYPKVFPLAGQKRLMRAILPLSNLFPTCKARWHLLFLRKRRRDAMMVYPSLCPPPQTRKVRFAPCQSCLQNRVRLAPAFPDLERIVMRNERLRFPLSSFIPAV